MTFEWTCSSIFFSFRQLEFYCWILCEAQYFYQQFCACSFNYIPHLTNHHSFIPMSITNLTDFISKFKYLACHRYPYIYNRDGTELHCLKVSLTRLVFYNWLPQKINIYGFHVVDCYFRMLLLKQMHAHLFCIPIHRFLANY